MKPLALALLLLCLSTTNALSESCSLSFEVAGKYVMSQPEGYLPNELLVTATSDSSKFVFDLEAYSSARPNDDGSQTSQSIFHGQFDFCSCIGHYFDPEDQCFFVFDFSENQVRVVDFGSCYFGHNAYPRGTYTKVSAKRTSKEGLINLS
jgi:hypothetical protein